MGKELPMVEHGMGARLAWQLLARATTFTFAGSTHVEKRADGDVWAIRRGATVWTRDGKWEHEPQPSSRDDAFLARSRWTLREASAEVCAWLGDESTFKQAFTAGCIKETDHADG